MNPSQPEDGQPYQPTRPTVNARRPIEIAFVGARNCTSVTSYGSGGC